MKSKLFQLQERETPLVDSQRVFIFELIDLCANNYIIVFEVYGTFLWFVKLRHLNNGRRLILRWDSKCCTLEEGGKLLKCYPEGAIPF